MTPLPPRSRSLRWPELVLAGLIVATGIALRAAYPERMAVEHFDEGVYASNWFCRPPGLPERVFPNQHLYAPPLLPELDRYVLFFSRGNAHAPMWVNVLLGSLMVPLVWWVARDWFGSVAGIVAALLAACSDAHIFFSRTALTDVPLCLFLLAGVWTGSNALLTGRLRWILPAAVFAALAWWTKYNGWLTLAITGAGLCGWLLFARPAGVRAWPLLLRGGAVAALAFALWSPVPWELRDVGGYQAVARNHARYVVGLSGWWGSLTRQWTNYQHISSQVGLIVCIAAITAGLTARLFCRRAQWAAAILAVVLLILLLETSMWLAGSTSILLVIGLAGALAGCRMSRREQDLPAIMDQRMALANLSRQGLASWIVLAWILGLVLTTPLYTPYPRLFLPCLTGAWLGVAAFVACGELGRHPGLLRRDVFVGLGVLGGTLFALHIQQRSKTVLLEAGAAWELPAWEDRGGTALAASRCVAAVAEDLDRQGRANSVEPCAVIYVFGDPALFYHLSAREPSAAFRYFVQPIGDLDLLDRNSTDPRLASYLVIGPAADPREISREDRSRLAEHRLLTDYQPPNLLIGLDRPESPEFRWLFGGGTELFRLTGWRGK